MFQEALRKRKEEEERVAQEKEFLRSSLRDSRKLQALESRPQPRPPAGIVNDGYSSTEDLESGADASSASTALPESLHKIVSEYHPLRLYMHLSERSSFHPYVCAFLR